MDPTSYDVDDIGRARALLEQARRVVVLTGAGISTDSGIADFRGPNGVWTKNPEAEKMATLQAYVSDPELRARAWQNRLTSSMWSAEPNAGHRALVDLERSGRLDLLVTQNIDGLHQKAGSDPARIVEIHGTSLEVMCLSCGDRQPAEGVHDRVRAGETDPACLATVDGGPGAGSGAVCGGILKSATISFGQSLVAEDLLRAEAGRGRLRPVAGGGLDVGGVPGRRHCAGGGAARRGGRHRERRADRNGRPGRRGVAGLHRPVPAGAGGGADPYFFSVVIPPSAFALRRGFSANHQMLAIVPSVTAAAATGLTTL